MAGIPRNPAVGFADILRQSAPNPPPELDVILRPSGLGTPMSARPREGFGGASLSGQPYGSGLSAFAQTSELGQLVPADDLYARSIALGLGGGAGLYSGVGHAHQLSQQPGAGMFLGLPGGAEPQPFVHGAAHLSSAALEQLQLELQLQQNPLLSSLLGASRHANAGPYFADNLALGRVGQLQSTANLTSVQLAQLCLQVQQLQQSPSFGLPAEATRRRAVSSGLLNPGSAFSAVPPSAASTESNLMALLRQMNELKQAETHATNLRGQLNLGQLDMERLVSTQMPERNNFVDPRITAMQQQAAAGRCSEGPGASRGDSAHNAGAWSGKVPFSTVLSGARSEDQNARPGKRSPGSSSKLKSDHGGDGRGGGDGGDSQASGLMALAEYAHMEMHRAALEGDPKDAEEMSGQKRKSNLSLGKRRKEAKVPKLAGPDIVAGEASTDAKGNGKEVARDIAGDDEEQRKRVHETATALLAISNMAEAADKQLQADQPQADAEGEGEMLDPHTLLLHLQTHKPPDDEEDEVAESEGREHDGAHASASSDDEAVKTPDEDDQDSKDAATCKAPRASVSILRKEDRIPKRLRLAPKAKPVGPKVGSGSARNGGGLVRVPRSSLFKKLDEGGRGIGVKGDLGSPGGVKDATPDTSPSQKSHEPSKEPEPKGDRKLKRTSALRLGAEISADPSPQNASAPCSVTELGGKKRDTREVRKSEPSADQAAINKLAKRLTDLADRIPYTGVLNSDPDVWTKFNADLDKITKVSDVVKQWIWLTRQIKPDMLLAKWRDGQHKEWLQKCQACETAEQLQALIKDFSTYAVDWAMASQRFLVEKGQSSAARQAGSAKKQERAHSTKSAVEGDDGVVKTPRLMGAKLARSSERQERQKASRHALSAASASGASSAKPGEGTPKLLPLDFGAGKAGANAPRASAPEIKRAWRYRKGRWMYVVVKDEPKKSPTNSDGSMQVEQSGAEEDKQDVVAIKSAQIEVVGQKAQAVSEVVRRRAVPKSCKGKDVDRVGIVAGSGKGAEGKMAQPVEEDSEGSKSGDLDVRVGKEAGAETEPVGPAAVKQLRKLLHRLVRRIHYTAFVCQDREMWREFHKMVDKGTSIRDLCERLVWASQNMLQRMMKSKWKARRKQWVRDCRSSRNTADFKLRCREFRSHIDWEGTLRYHACLQIVGQMFLDDLGTSRAESVRVVAGSMAVAAKNASPRGKRSASTGKRIASSESQRHSRCLLHTRGLARIPRWLTGSKFATPFPQPPPPAAVDASVYAEAHRAEMRLGGTYAGAEGSADKVGMDADSTAGGEEAQGANGRDVKKEIQPAGDPGGEAAEDAIGDGVGDEEGEGSRRRNAQGIVEMRKMVNRLVRRIHYSAFVCPSKETWVSYHQSVGRSASATEVAERLAWAARQLLPDMLRPSWMQRRKQWEERCQVCRDKNALRLLKFELEKYAINWEAVEASTIEFEREFVASSSSIGMCKKPSSPQQAAKQGTVRAQSRHAKDSSFKRKVRSKDERTGSKGRGTAPAQNGGDAREGRLTKRRRCGSAADGGAGGEERGSGAERAPKEQRALAVAGGA